MSLSENASRKPIALLDLPQDGIDRATVTRLELANFRVIMGTAQDPGDPIDVAVVRARPVGPDEASVAAALEAALLLTRTAVAAMSQNGGRIIHVVSSVGRYRSAWFRGRSENGSHVARAAIEGALLGQTRQLAFELAPRRIRVNAVAYGWIRGINPEPDATLCEREKEALLTEISLRRPGEPDEVAGVIAFLAGSASSYITGAVLEVNGGWWMS
jgi:NAD(P)-dependent dehydrogenase (short-subunit alcohol dehydrogenase family)